MKDRENNSTMPRLPESSLARSKCYLFRIYKAKRIHHYIVESSYKPSQLRSGHKYIIVFLSSSILGHLVRPSTKVFISHSYSLSNRRKQHITAPLWTLLPCNSIDCTRRSGGCGGSWARFVLLDCLADNRCRDLSIVQVSALFILLEIKK
jgi:hypothetical protein